MKVGEFDAGGQAGDAGNIEQGGNSMKEGETRGGEGWERWLRMERARWGLRP